MSSASALLPKTIKSIGMWGYNKMAAKYEKISNAVYESFTKVTFKQQVCNPNVADNVGSMFTESVLVPRKNVQKYWTPSLQSFKTTIKENAVRAQRQLIRSDVKSAENFFSRDFLWRRARKSHLIAFAGLFLYQEESQELHRKSNKQYEIYSRICDNIKDLFPIIEEEETLSTEQGNILSDYKLKDCLSMDASGITYDAELVGNEDNLDFEPSIEKSYNYVNEVSYSWVYADDVPQKKQTKGYAVKAMYPTPGVSSYEMILKRCEAELACCGYGRYTFHNGNQPKKKPIPSHPNILRYEKVFIDNFPSMYDCQWHAGSSSDRNNSPILCAVSKRYDTSLRSWLYDNNPDGDMVSIILLQVFEALAHLEEHQYVHRDVNAENIFLQFNQDCVPRVILGGFGHCFGGSKNDVCVPFEVKEFDTRVGKKSMQPPEASRSTPKSGNYIDYRKSDVWSAGLLAYELITGSNPFEGAGHDKGLDSRTYSEQDLPDLNKAEVSDVLKNIARLSLSVDPSTRLSAREAADLLHLEHFATPPSGQCDSSNDLRTWAVAHCAEAILRRSSDAVLFGICESFFRHLDAKRLVTSLRLWMMLRA